MLISKALPTFWRIAEMNRVTAKITSQLKCQN